MHGACVGHAWRMPTACQSEPESEQNQNQSQSQSQRQSQRQNQNQIGVEKKGKGKQLRNLRVWQQTIGNRGNSPVERRHSPRRGQIGHVATVTDTAGQTQPANQHTPERQRKMVAGKLANLGHGGERGNATGTRSGTSLMTHVSLEMVCPTGCLVV